MKISILISSYQSGEVFFNYFANFASLFFRMIGAMPAVAVRHERKRQEKRLKRPSQLYLGGQWMPPPQGSPPTPSPHGHNSHLEPLPELYLCGKVISRHMSQWPTSSWPFYRSRYASWVCFVIARMFDFCTLSNYGQCIMNSKLSECLKNYWSYYLDSTVNTVNEKKYLHCIFIFFQWNKRKIYCTRIEIYNSQNEFSNMITSNNL